MRKISFQHLIGLGLIFLVGCTTPTATAINPEVTTEVVVDPGAIPGPIETEEADTETPVSGKKSPGSLTPIEPVDLILSWTARLFLAIDHTNSMKDNCVGNQITAGDDLANMFLSAMVNPKIEISNSAKIPFETNLYILDDQYSNISEFSSMAPETNIKAFQKQLNSNISYRNDGSWALIHLLQRYLEYIKNNADLDANLIVFWDGDFLTQRPATPSGRSTAADKRLLVEKLLKDIYDTSVGRASIHLVLVCPPPADDGDTVRWWNSLHESSVAASSTEDSKKTQAHVYYQYLDNFSEVDSTLEIQRFFENIMSAKPTVENFHSDAIYWGFTKNDHNISLLPITQKAEAGIIYISREEYDGHVISVDEKSSLAGGLLQPKLNCEDHQLSIQETAENIPYFYWVSASYWKFTLTTQPIINHNDNLQQLSAIIETNESIEWNNIGECYKIQFHLLDEENALPDVKIEGPKSPSLTTYHQIPYRLAIPLNAPPLQRLYSVEMLPWNDNRLPTPEKSTNTLSLSFSPMLIEAYKVNTRDSFQAIQFNFKYLDGQYYPLTSDTNYWKPEVYFNDPNHLCAYAPAKAISHIDDGTQAVRWVLNGNNQATLHMKISKDLSPMDCTSLTIHWPNLPQAQNLTVTCQIQWTAAGDGKYVLSEPKCQQISK